ncbi:MAG: amidohydrolase [Rubripirellula sp.]
MSQRDHSSIIQAIDQQVAHLWMVRTFLKHADESEDDEELRDIVRDLYDFILAVGPLDDAESPQTYLKFAKKKLGKLKRATKLYEEIQPEVSGHTNFLMAARSLRLSVDRIEELIMESKNSEPSSPS